MFPRLLTQSDLDSRKSADRRREVEEGAKLARRVDGLRELAAETEKNVEQHRSASLAQAQRDIDAVLSKKELLEGEVRELEEERKRLQTPLDVAWEKIRQESKQNADERLVLEQRDETIRQTSIEQENVAKQLREEGERVVQERKRSMSLLKKAASDQEKAQTILLEAHELKEETTNWSVHKTNELTKREKAALIREQELILQAEQVEEGRLQNENDRKKLKDAYETLARTKKRLGI